MKIPRIKVTCKSLKRERKLGKAYKETGDIEICNSLSGEIRLDTLIHECLHVIFPDLIEERVDEAATIVAKVLWEQNYRRVDA